MQYWVIPPEADAEFMAAMEEVLETYEEPYHPEFPVVCMDEQTRNKKESTGNFKSKDARAKLKSLYPKFIT
jgi:hypothetical protein